MENSEGGNKSLFYEFDFNEDLTQMNIEEPIGNLKRQEERSKQREKKLPVLGFANERVGIYGGKQMQPQNIDVYKR